MLSFGLNDSRPEAKTQKENIVYADQVSWTEDGFAKVYVRIRNNQGMMGYRIHIRYDSSQIEVKKISQGGIMNQGIFQDNLGQKDGAVDVLWSGTEDMKKNGVLFSLSVQSKQKKQKEAVIHLSSSQEDTFNEKWEDVELHCNLIRIDGKSSPQSTSKPEQKNEETKETVNAVVNELLQQDDGLEIFEKISAMEAEYDAEQKGQETESFSELTKNQQEKIAEKLLDMYADNEVLKKKDLSSKEKIEIVKEIIRRSKEQKNRKTIDVSKALFSKKQESLKKENSEKKVIGVVVIIITAALITVYFWIKKRRERCGNE